MLMKDYVLEKFDENHIRINEFNIRFNRETVLNLIDCYPDSPVYDDTIDEYERLAIKAYEKIAPEAILRYGKVKSSLGSDKYNNCESACYVIYTIGNEIAELSSEYFSQGDYLAAMLVDAMANDYLMQMDQAVTNIVYEQCKKRHVGVLKRLEAPSDIPLEAQKTVLEETGADKEWNLGITEGYMFTIVKTDCYVLILTEDENIFEARHDCTQCELLDCKMRKTLKIEVIRSNQTYTVNHKKSDSVLDTLIKHGYQLSAVCGGQGTCGKCKIQFLSGSPIITIQDRKIFGQDELDIGYRLACKAYPNENCKVKLTIGDESDFEIVSEDSMVQKKDDAPEDSHEVEKGREPLYSKEAYGIVCDIGTTTIVISLIRLSDRSNIKNYSTINKQRVYGANVISRIQASNEGKKNQLRKLVKQDLMTGFCEVITQAGIRKEQVKKIVIASNTTMGHILLGYSCESLGVYPYTPVNINLIELEYAEIFNSDYLDASVTVLPGISTFVGADIVAGLLVCDFDKEKSPNLFIDIGTNGEMALGNKNRILVSSTAAGPAFEGGNISCGIGSVSGAICSVDIEGDKLKYKTIGSKPPIGICGTGVIEITSELFKAGIIDETGLLQEKFFEDGYTVFEAIKFTQQDIREVQLAKSAICAGIETLILRYGISYNDIGTVYLAGGFGYKININKAIGIGLIPKELSGKIKTIGNSSLAGAKKYLTCTESRRRIERIVSISDEVNLSSDKDFNELYVRHMYFK